MSNKHTPINRDEKCAFCGFPRHAHWGGPQALVSGRCAGFESSAATSLSTAAPELLDALEKIEQQLDYGQIDTARRIAFSTLLKYIFHRQSQGRTVIEQKG